jgi:hypothetical protein
MTTSRPDPGPWSDDDIAHEVAGRGAMPAGPERVVFADPEVDAIRQATGALMDLDVHARIRVIRYLCERFSLSRASLFP